ncbi:MAG: D-tyrosyl-tRNA(Tyr) deacylase [Bacilli bacterium]|nr:D-tyrosyl-tRNA(Tyr) deacylase [Bacilli bacterium]
MRVVLQRVDHAKCTVDNKVTGKIDKGYMLLVGFTHDDNIDKVKKAAKKIAGLRIFEDDNHKMNLNLEAVKGSILSISQFTLYANTNEGNRPSFVDAMEPVKAKELYLKFNEELRTYGFVVEEGIFGAHMDIELLNSGPVTIIYEF